jgi:hypothetical protein
MDVRFEDHASFQRCAAWCAGGGAALGATGSLPLAAAGTALALLGARHGGRRLAAACACAAVAVAWAVLALPWAAAVAGAMFGLLFAVDRGDAAKEKGAAPPSGWAVAMAAASGAIAVAAAAALLPALSAGLASVMPRWTAGMTMGGALGLWAALSAAPLHLRFGTDALEMRLDALRFVLGPELRPLAERAAAARRSAGAKLPAGVPSEIPASIDALAAAALELAARAAELSRAASPQAEDELQRRCAWLLQSAQAAVDVAAKRSYENAREALSAQLDHLRRVRRERERVLARLHENVANLERTQFSLTLLHGPGIDAELALLQQCLRQGATAFEEA